MLKTIRLSMLMLLCSTAVLVAQNTRIYLKIQPYGNPLQVEVNKPIQFSAKAIDFANSNTGHEVPIDHLVWSVDPPTFGSIDQTGVFTATGPAGGLVNPEGRVIAIATIGSMTLQGVVSVRLKAPDPVFDYMITGTVNDGTGAPIPNVVVKATGTSNPASSSFSAKTNENGVYEIKIPAGSYFVHASKEGYIPEYYDNTSTIQTATKLTTDPNNKTIAGINFVLDQAGKITGRVLSAADNTPIRDASVFAFAKSGTGTPGGSNAGYAGKLDEHGIYVISGVLPGEYIVQAYARGFQMQYYDKVKDVTLATLVQVQQGATVSDIDFLLERDVVIHPDWYYYINGTVADAANQPIAGAMITASKSSPDPANTTQFYAYSEKDGSYTLKVLAGTYLVHATASGFMREYYDNVSDASLATPVTVGSSTPAVSDIDFTLGTGGRITGTVLNATDNSPVKGAWITTTDRNSSGSIPGVIGKGGAMTDESGNYTLTGLATGEYTVMALKDGFAVQYFDGVEDPTLATKVQVTVDQTTSGINFALNRLPGISGTVLDAATNKPIAKAEVVAENNNGIRTVAHTNEHGEYSLTLHAGTYIIRASSFQYSTEWYNEKSSASLADPVTVSSSNITGINFTLEGWNGGISGVVTDDQNNPIGGAIVKAWSAPTSSTPNHLRFYISAVTASDGTYLLPGLPPGRFYVLASAKGYISEYYDNATSIIAATPVDVTTQITPGINFSLGTGGSITGTVLDAKTNLPIKGAFVSIRNTGTHVEMGAKTDDQGVYTLSGLATGDYYLFATAHGYQGRHYHDPNNPNHPLPVHVSAPNTTSGINFSLDPALTKGRFKFTGMVLEAQTLQKLPLNIVEVINTVTGATVSTTTNEEGRFTVFSDEQCVVRARAVGFVGMYAGEKRTWQESSPQHNTGEIQFALEPVSETGFASLSGRVTDTKSQAGIPNAWVFGFDAEGNSFFDVTDAGGNYIIHNTDTGTLDLMVSGAQYTPAQGSGSVEGTSGTQNMSANRVGGTTDVDRSVIPTALALSQNYPNPFNPSTTIRYGIPSVSRVTLQVVNLLGAEVATLVDETQQPGTYSINWNAASVPSGIYLYKLTSNGRTITRQMVLLK